MNNAAVNRVQSFMARTAAGRAVATFVDYCHAPADASLSATDRQLAAPSYLFHNGEWNIVHRIAKKRYEVVGLSPLFSDDPAAL